MRAELTVKSRAANPQLIYFARERRGRKSSIVYEDMKRQILVGELTADSTITEQSLADHYECSQSTIREALLLLQEDGLVIRRGYQGTFVTQTTNEEALILFRLRLNIECGTVGQVIANMTASRMDELRALSEEYDKARDERSIIGVSEADITFHMTLLRMSDMPTLEPVLLRTLLHLHRFVITRHQHKIKWIDEVEASHSTLLDALASKDKDRATQLVIEHATTNTIEVSDQIQDEVLSLVTPDFTDRL